MTCSKYRYLSVYDVGNERKKMFINKIKSKSNLYVGKYFIPNSEISFVLGFFKIDKKINMAVT
jgi:hypothetical protein